MGARSDIRTYREFWPYYLEEHSKAQTRILHFIGTTLVFVALAAAIATRNWWLLLLMPVAGYGFAWVAHFMVEHNRPTTIKTRIIAHSQQVVRFDREAKSSIEKETHQQIYAYVKQEVLDGLDAIIVSDYCKGVVTRGLVRDIVALAKKHKVVVSVDPKISHFNIYSGVTILTPNTKEASLGSKIDIDDEKSLIRAGKQLLSRLKCSAVLITRGEHGMSLFEQGRITHIPTNAREVYDVTGAGDTVISVLTLAMAAGASLGDAARLSNFAAGIVVGIVGTATVKPEELKQKITADNTSEKRSKKV